jgi:ABC transporter with metal-binding/Fe-S-binding domain ATP-binding protein
VKVIALLSGGKDSVAAIEVAQGHGWEIVAALTMVPAEDDAWMFHTPNLAAVRGVAQCLGIPLIEAPCRNGKDEEVEDLEAALRAAYMALRFDGIVSGALASEYQRTRIDRIGHRIGVPTFAPLWHKDSATHVRQLLSTYDVRFARTAAEGVPSKWAGQRMTEEHVTAMLNHQAKPHVAGEGGEYETLVLDAPHYKRRLVVDKARVDATSNRATWVVEAWHTDSK